MKKKSRIDHLKVESKKCRWNAKGKPKRKAQKVERILFHPFLPIFEIPQAFLILWV